MSKKKIYGSKIKEKCPSKVTFSIIPPKEGEKYTAKSLMCHLTCHMRYS